jgi:hypothetical protein
MRIEPSAYHSFPSGVVVVVVVARIVVVGRIVVVVATVVDVAADCRAETWDRSSSSSASLLPEFASPQAATTSEIMIVKPTTARFILST